MQQFTDQASSMAGHVDTVFLVLIALSVAIAGGVFTAMAVFILRYRRGRNVNRANPPSNNLIIEALWIGIPLVLALSMFTWAASLYFTLANPPSNAIEIYVVGKQWMWKFQHAEGPAEISELHIPVNEPIKLTMISQDVIHSMFVPAFRAKQDVLPGRYTTLWFQATQTGNYHIECTQYCGTDHAIMGGQVIVMEQEAYQQWLDSNSQIVDAQPVKSMASAGAQLFQKAGCAGCHTNNGSGPSLIDLYGSDVQLADGTTVTADETYIRESLMQPNSQIVAGYKPIMPSYQGQLSEEDVMNLISYLKSSDVEAMR